MIEYKNEHGHCNAPNTSRLGRWAYMIRQTWGEMNGRYGPQTPNNSNPGDNNNVSGSNNNNSGSGIDTLAHAAAKTEEENIVSKIISVEIGPGKLGLSVQFPEDCDEGGFEGN